MILHVTGGKDPRYMTYLAFRGFLDRLEKLRRWQQGAGQTMHERLEQIAAEKDE